MNYFIKYVDTIYMKDGGKVHIYKIMKTMFYVFIFVLIFSSNSFAYTKIEGIESFPTSYKPYIQELQNRHPNWTFTAFYTNLDWNYVIDNENYFGRSLVPKSYSDNWKNTNEGEYNYEVDSGFVDASRNAVEYTMDPRNFLNDVRVFQFEALSYNEVQDNLQGIEKILYGTEFYNKTVEYVDSNLNKIVTQSKYSELILQAGRISGVSPYHLASRIKQEVGPFLSHSSISGTVSGYEGLYNFYNIGATSSSVKLGAIKNGLNFSRNGNGANATTLQKYQLPWNTKERAITGGAIFIGSSYINIGQDTVYFQKFAVNDEQLQYIFWHQYMTNILAPYSESRSIYNGYSNTGLLDEKMNFIIPIYNNMPQIPVESPNINTLDYVQDNTRMYANVSTKLNVRSGPGVSYEVITTISKDDSVTRIAKGVQNGELWDRILLDNGIVGYVSQSYMVEIKTEQEKINEEMQNEQVNVETTLEEQIISGLNITQNSVENFKNNNSKFINCEFRNANNKVLTNVDLIGTGTTAIVDNVKYSFVLYGDVNGDGKINSTDLLVLQRHILQIQELNGVFLVAGNINKNGKKPSSVDSLIIQRHILGLTLISQSKEE